MKNKTYGFTLAEVLITLVIIGVIAAMTIPTLINKTNKQDTISRLKKAYSTMAQATNRILADEGDPRADIGGWATSADDVFNMYSKYLSKAKSCPKGTKECFPNSQDINNNSLIFADGTMVSFYDDSFHLNCDHNGAGTNDICMSFMVDVNGKKGPNAKMKDIFMFELTKDRFVPYGCGTSSSTCMTSPDWYCTCKFIREGVLPD